MNSLEIEKLLSIAAKTSSEEDYENLFKNLAGAELFFNVTESRQDGTKHGATRSAPVSTPLVAVRSGFNAVLFYTSNSNANLKKPYAGIKWKHALEMVCKMEQADGLVIQSADSAWVGIDKQKAKQLFATLSN